MFEEEIDVKMSTMTNELFFADGNAMLPKEQRVKHLTLSFQLAEKENEMETYYKRCSPNNSGQSILTISDI